jgi:hypothetical protein
MTTTITNTLPVVVSEAHEAWKRAHALRLLESMYAWANDGQELMDLREEAGRERCVPDWLLVRVHSRSNWYLVPNVSTYPTIADYIDATRAALDADVLAYQAEVATAENAQSKRRREALKAERAAAAPPAPERAQPTRASKRARQRVIHL